MSLTEFLLARIAEDEAVAHEYAAWQDAQPPRQGSWVVMPWEMLHQPFDPARVLRECEAKRWIIEEHADGRDDWSLKMSDPEDPGYCRVCAEGFEDCMTHPCPTLRHLATPFADHPDYRPEWKP